MWFLHDIGWGWLVVMPVAMIVFWSVVVWAVVLLVRAVPSWSGRRPQPRAVLDQRLAAGQISLEEYNRLRAALGDPPRPAHA